MNCTKYVLLIYNAEIHNVGNPRVIWGNIVLYEVYEIAL